MHFPFWHKNRRKKRRPARASLLEKGIWIVVWVSPGVTRARGKSHATRPATCKIIDRSCLLTSSDSWEADAPARARMDGYGAAGRLYLVHGAHFSCSFSISE